MKTEPLQNSEINETERDAVYKTIYGRRDIRSFFKPDPVSAEVLARVLKAAHRAGSVGYMQPWNFIVVDDFETRKRVKRSFEREREDAAREFSSERREKYLTYKLEGILEAPINLVVTSDPTRFGPQVIGRHSVPETDVYSTCCAIQNLWLAARAENVGVGWVSIVKREDLYEIFQIPRHLTIVAYLCLGYVTHFPEKPDLEKLGWGNRVPLSELVFFNQWQGRTPEAWRDLHLLLEEGERPHF